MKVKIVVFLSLSALSSCASEKSTSVHDESNFLHVEGFDPLAVVFLEGSPRDSADLLQSIDNEAGAHEVLVDNLKLIKSRPGVVFQVTGWTDDVECNAVRSCMSLSLDRASLVTRWYEDQGAMNLAPPEGRGIYVALPEEPTERDRRIARRAELKVK